MGSLARRPLPSRASQRGGEHLRELQEQSKALELLDTPLLGERFLASSALSRISALGHSMTRGYARKQRIESRGHVVVSANVRSALPVPADRFGLFGQAVCPGRFLALLDQVGFAGEHPLQLHARAYAELSEHLA